MPLHFSMLQSAARVLSFGELLGTAFLLTVASDARDGHRYGYFVTAHHVIANQIEIEVQAPDPFTTGTLQPPIPVEDWRQPLEGVDLAVAPFNPVQDDRRYRSGPLENCFPAHGMESPRLGEHVYYVGIFEPLLRPMARSGVIGALEQTAIPHARGYVYDAHLVDCRSYDGFSGSPVFADIAFVKLDEAPKFAAHTDDSRRLATVYHWAMLCGMFTAHYSDEQTAGGVVSRYGVGVMLPSSQIRKALMTDEAREERAKWDAERAATKRRSSPPLRNAGLLGPEEDEFDRFENLTRKLVNVPKKELDEKREWE